MGGVAREWAAELPADLAAGSELTLHLVMTKFGSPSVRIAYEIRLQVAITVVRSSSWAGVKVGDAGEP